MDGPRRRMEGMAGLLLFPNCRTRLPFCVNALFIVSWSTPLQDRSKAVFGAQLFLPRAAPHHNKLNGPQEIDIYKNWKGPCRLNFSVFGHQQIIQFKFLLQFKYGPFQFGISLL